MVVDNGVGLLTWGILVVIGMILTYASVHLGVSMPSTLIWAVVIGVGWLLSIWLGWINVKRSRTRTFIQKVLWSMWSGLGITMTIIGFLGTVAGAISGWASIPLCFIDTRSRFLCHRRNSARAVIGRRGRLLVGRRNRHHGPAWRLFLSAFCRYDGLLSDSPGVYLYRKWKKQIHSEP